MIKLILTSGQCPGDICMLTAALRDLHAAHPGRYLTDVRTPHPDMFANNPHVTPLTEGREIPMHYDLIHESNGKPWHFIHGYRMHLENVLGIKIPQGAFRGDIHLTPAEKTKRPAGVPSAYWVIASGGKNDYTAKWWDPQRWQAVVDYWTARGVAFVQVGGKGDVHPPLKGVTNLVGKTTLRQLIHIIAHADGVLCPVTSLMHIAAALPMEGGGRNRPCVVVAGGREPSQWEVYPGHAFLETIGQLPCCAAGGCWKARVVPGIGGELDKSLCERPVEVRAKVHIPACLDRITPAMVIEAMARYMDFPKTTPAAKPCGGCGGSAPANTDPQVWGPQKWRELHHRAGRADDPTLLDEPKEAAWIGKFIAGLPCIECREEATKLLVAYPPQLQSRDAYRWWGIEFHNAVNRRLGKPVLSIEEAEAKIAASLPRDAKGIHERHMICSKCEHYGTIGVALACTRDNQPLKGKLINGDCEKWPGYVTLSVPPPKVLRGEPAANVTLSDETKLDGPFYVYNPEDPEDGARGWDGGGNKASVGVVIGTYGAVAYIHLQLESLRRFHPGTPVLVVDDGSPSRDALAALCKEYGADFLWREKRMNHARGDMHTFVYGHRWAKAHGVRLLVKFSRRWVPVAPWIGAAIWLWQTSGAPTLCNTCSCHGFGFRSECVAMDVNAWANADACDVFEQHIAASADQPGDLDVGKSGMLVEHIAHIGAAAAKAKAEWTGPLNFEPWPWMGTSRCSPIEGVLWHETHKAPAYAYQAAAWGLNRTVSEFINPQENITE